MTGDAYVVRRLLVVALILEGHSARRRRGSTGWTAITIGVLDLNSRFSTGWPAALNEAQMEALRAPVRAGPDQPLPPYSPDLTPMENIWDGLRGNKLSRSVWDSCKAIIAAGKDSRRFPTGDPERIAAVAHRTWAHD